MPASQLMTAFVGAATVGAGAGAAFLGSSSCQMTVVIAKAIPPEIARTIVYSRALLMVRYPGIPVTPYADAPMPMNAATRAPTAPPIMPPTKGFMKRMLTPKIAGSVIPRAADMDEGIATALVFWFLHLIPTARQAPNCAKLAAEAMGIQVLRPLEASIPASMTLYIWCRPMTTVQGYRAPMMQEPMGLETSFSAPARTMVSRPEKIGPIIVNVTRAVTRTVVRGVTNRSIISGTCLCSHVSSLDMNSTASMTGIT